MNQNTKIIDLPPAKHLNAHHWTNEEKLFKRKERILTKIEHLNVPLQSGLLYKLSKSVFGPFLKELNTRQFQDHIVNENKLQVLQWHLKRYNDHDTNIIRERNLVVKDFYELLQKAVNDCDVIDLGFLRKHLKSIYLNCCFIKQIDNSLQKFEHIRVLTLCGNFIKDIPGILLPRSLEFLELFDNFIADLSSFVQHAPKSIHHLGLGRNRLTDNSQLHLLAKSNNFTRLTNIDLSHNDICNLEAVVGGLKSFRSLQALSLEGNPCSVLPEYRKYILQSIPHVQYLDNTQILKSDREDPEQLLQLDKKAPQILFQCYRILGLPEPPKDKHNIQTIHIEVNFPLLIQSPLGPEKDMLAEVPVPHEEIKGSNSKDSNNNNNKNKKAKDKNHKAKNNKKEKEEKTELKKGKKKSYYAGDNEYDKEWESRNVWFKTERMPWSKIIEFPPLKINHFDKGLTVIRDVFRSIVPVRVVYLKVALSSPKQKKQAANRKPTKKEKDSKKNASQQEDVAASETPEEPEQELVETVVKKITLASFYCELKSINWSDTMMDFYWADHPDLGERALRVEGSLKALEYDVTASPKKQASDSAGNGPSGKQFLPNVLTCQVGFGLRRI